VGGCPGNASSDRIEAKRIGEKYEVKDQQNSRYSLNVLRSVYKRPESPFEI
jgi:hypothetical protein